MVEKEIEKHILDTKNTTVPEQIDASSLQPKKADWDLKRNIGSQLDIIFLLNVILNFLWSILEKKMEKLERRTQRAIATIIRERLAAGQADLASAVSAGAENA